MRAAGLLRYPLKAVSYETLIGLLACTGMRVSEAIRLDHGVVDAIFRALSQNAGIDRTARGNPRAHDLRHTFAVETLSPGIDPAAASAPVFPFFPPSWATPVLPRRTGISRRHRSCCRSPPSGWRGRSDQSRPGPGVVPRRAPDPTAPSEPRGNRRVQLITAFLAYLEHDRHNSVRTRNARLAAIRSRLRYATLCYPECAALIQRVLAIPDKRSERTIVTLLTDIEVCTLVDAPDRQTWTGRRDLTLVAVAIRTGLRVSELTRLTCSDV